MLYIHKITTEKLRVAKNEKPTVKLMKWNHNFKSRNSEVKSSQKLVT